MTAEVLKKIGESRSEIDVKIALIKFCKENILIDLYTSSKHVLQIMGTSYSASSRYFKGMLGFHRCKGELGSTYSFIDRIVKIWSLRF